MLEVSVIDTYPTNNMVQIKWTSIAVTLSAICMFNISGAFAFKMLDKATEMTTFYLLATLLLL